MFFDRASRSASSSTRLLKTSSFSISALVLLACSCAGTAVQAQTVPDAGSILNQIERTLPVPSLPQVGPLVQPKIELLKGRGERLTVKRFVFSANSVVSNEALEATVAPYLNRALTSADLQNAAAAIALAYRQKGYIATAKIPPQEVKNGVVRIQIIEARFSGAVLDKNSTGRINPEILISRIESAAKAGELVNIYGIDRGLLIINDLPGAAVSGGLDEGTKEGETRLVLLSEERPLFGGTVSGDNFGSRSTGSARATGDISVNSALGEGEQATLNGLHTQGTDYGRIGFSVPVGPLGTRVGVNGSYLDYALVSREYKAGNFHGTSSTVGADLIHPLIRSRTFNLYLTASYDGKWFSNRADQTVSSEYRTDVASVGMSSNLYDGLLAGGVNTASFGYVFGRVDLNGSPNKPSDAASTRSQGDFGKLKFALSRTQSITDDLSLLASFSGQHAFKNLDSSEKLFLGGPTGLRAYPVSEGGGSSGFITSLEAHYKLPHGFKVLTFLDYGQITQNVNNTFAGAATNNSMTYRGYGLGLNWQGPANSTVKVVWAHRIGQNPNPSSTGHDQDGSKHVDRFWLSSSISF